MGISYWNEELETKPWREVEIWQASQIEMALPKVKQNSQLYGRLYAEVPDDIRFRSLKDLAALPFTLKDHIRTAQADISNDTPFGTNQAASVSDIVQIVSSSGTSGNPLYYTLTRSDLNVWTDAIASGFFTAGLRKTDVVAHLVALPMLAGGLPYADAFRSIGATLCWLGGFSTERIVQEMYRLRITALLATTSFGVYLSELWQEAGQEIGLPSNMKKVLCGGESGLNQKDIRNKIESGLGISHLREVMGLGDVIPCLWAECEECNGMHFTAQRYVAIELINPDTEEVIPIEPGATGEIVYTGFARESMPLIRYRSRDHIQVIDTVCGCGRTSPRIRCIGRTDDMLIYKGMNVFPTAVRDLISEKFAGQVEPLIRIWKDQADQVRFDEAIPVDVEVKEEIPKAAYQELSNNIEKEVRSRMQVRISVTIVSNGTLPRGTYKTSLVAVR